MPSKNNRHNHEKIVATTVKIWTLIVNEMDCSCRPDLKPMGAAAAETEHTAEQHDFRNVLTRHVKTKQRPAVVHDLQVLTKLLFFSVATVAVV